MQDVWSLLANPVMLKALFKLLLSYFVFSAFVGALPMPDTGVPGWFGSTRPSYRFIFTALNGLAANLQRAAVALKVPGAQPDPPAAAHV